MNSSGVVLVMLLLCAAGMFHQASSQEGPEEGSAIRVFRRTLEERGIEAAIGALREMAADTSKARSIDGRELMMEARLLAAQEKRGEAIELTKLLAELYPKSGQPWYELGSLYLFTLDAGEAQRCFRRCLELEPGHPSAEWVLANIEELSRIAAIQVDPQKKLAPGESTGRQGPYLGEEPPGATPEVFAPGIVSSTANDFSITFSPDGREIYFSRGGIGVMVCRWEKEGWTFPETVPFHGDSLLCDEPGVAPDDGRIFFNARRSLRDDRVVYVADRTSGGWGPPRELFLGMYPTASRDGTLYYTARGQGRDYGAIVLRRLLRQTFSEPELVGGGANSPSPDAHPFIAPDESLLLFDSGREPPWSLYVCFRDKEGSWGEAICLNEHLGIPRLAGQCALTPDGKYLFFSLHDDMYWVDAQKIEELRPK